MSRVRFWQKMRWSISTRLTLWFGTTLLLLLSLFAAFSYVAFHERMHQDFDRHLTHEARELEPFIRLDPEGPMFEDLGNVRSVAYQTDGIFGTYVRLLDASGRVVYQSPNFEHHESLRIQIPDSPDAQSVSFEWEGNPARSLYTALVYENETVAGWLEVTGFEWSLHQGLEQLGRALILGILFSVTLVAIAGYGLARRTLRPVATLTESARHIGASNLSQRLPAQFGVHDELTDMAETFNDLIARLEASFNRERRFTDNAAHELQNPLASLRNVLEISLRRERTPEAYQQVIQTALVDVREMSATVRSLLQLARLERAEELPRLSVNLTHLCREHFERFIVRAQEQQIDFVLSLEEAVWIEAEPVRIGEVIDNLIDNALKYTPNGGRVETRVAQRDDNVLLEVVDSGLGFRPEEEGHLFDRFYRSESPEVKARTGSGLGLSILAAIVAAYGGTVSAHSAGPNQGSRFLVLLPKAKST